MKITNPVILRPRARDLLLGLVIVLLVAVSSGCASTKVTTRQSSASTDLPEPVRIVVYDFATSPDEIAADDPIADEVVGREGSASEEEQGLAHKLAQAPEQGQFT